MPDKSYGPATLPDHNYFLAAPLLCAFSLISSMQFDNSPAHESLWLERPIHAHD
jgi:hypothetical protein